MQEMEIEKPHDEKASRDGLVQAYQRTSYIVDDEDVTLTIRLGAKNDELNEMLAERGASAWAFLTAYNPFSTPLPESDNLARQAELTKHLEVHNLNYLRGYGKGDDPSWEPEPSLLILDIGRDDAIAIGQTFEQNAILWGEVGAMPELIWCYER